MSKFKIRHVTKYTYDNTVRDSANQIMLYPIEDDDQQVMEHTIAITGNPPIDQYSDSFGNKVGVFTNAHPHSELLIDSNLIVVTQKRRIVDNATPADIQWRELEKLKSDLHFIDFLKQERFDALPEVRAVIESERNKNSSPLEVAEHFCNYIYDSFTYQKGITTVESTLDEIWKLKSGVCQDFAHILLAMLRLMNIPARYVSGYICPKKNGMRGEGATHAWVEAYIPSYGWLGFDPTNNCIVTETHVRLAVGKNFSDCSPVKGTYRGTAEHVLDVTVVVSYEDGHSTGGNHEIVMHEPRTSVSQNSFRRHQEIQMQQ
ncbi:MAG: transglutaminase family protein [Cyclobacteriaceae bacterium]|nr:transglutaminase family protein [Cyclobacteriaceae bacterium]